VKRAQALTPFNQQFTYRPPFTQCSSCLSTAAEACTEQTQVIITSTMLKSGGREGIPKMMRSDDASQACLFIRMPVSRNRHAGPPASLLEYSRPNRHSMVSRTLEASPFTKLSVRTGFRKEDFCAPASLGTKSPPPPPGFSLWEAFPAPTPLKHKHIKTH
jgi:hypothetical protein